MSKHITLEDYEVDLIIQSLIVNRRHTVVEIASAELQKLIKKMKRMTK